jgi:hypothetical protein
MQISSNLHFAIFIFQFEISWVRSAQVVNGELLITDLPKTKTKGGPGYGSRTASNPTLL